ncbi:hypothetical protein [Nodosilinea sp. E11]|uniref:nSTAND1 domain-containing NTPase n=1 Tax=Nodosilinea sp. E11 TaxID=3037479 RepID=UPI002934CAB3|nr:hypothetical protein [Nodosilinea sp. E11]WOD41899.1 hypothetical protein RRF56_13975 [Nodosilinea sp. E11]
MDEIQVSHGIQIQSSAVGSAIVSGDGNIIHVIYQTAPPSPVTPKTAPQSLDPNPYQGLATFTEQDGDRYFGREAQIQRLWQRFQDLAAQSTQVNAIPRLLPILGPSGCGKSSLARAGLIPELARRPLPGKTSLRVVVLVPGSHPLEALAGVLAKTATQDPLPVTKTREFTAELGLVNTTGEYDGLRRIANLIPKIHDMPLVVLVDQFEEVYSLCKEDQERQAFIDNLLTAAQDSSGQVSVVITLRSDFLGETQRHPALSQVIGSDQSVIVPPMTAAELREAIARPAERSGHPLDAAIIDLLVQDTEGREGALPLLQFALTRIWEGLGQEVVPAEIYRQMGGVGGALAGKAQEIYDHLSPAEQETARRIFLGLVQLGEGTRDTRRRAPVASLIASQDSPEAVKQVLARFSSPGVRLLTLASHGDGEVAEVTHEALFGYWQALNEWLDSSRDDIRFQRRLDEAATYWNQHGRPNGLLWRPPALDLLKTFAQKARSDMSASSVAFFEAADQANQREKRLKQWAIRSLVAGLVFTTTLSGFAGYKVYESERRRMQLYAATSENLADIDDIYSLVYGLAAIGLGRSPFIKLPNLQRPGLVSTAVLDKPNRAMQAHYVAGHREVTSVAISADGQTLVSGSEDGTVRLWDHEGNPIGEPIQGHTAAVTSVAASVDGQTIASSSEDRTVRLWDHEGNPIGRPMWGHVDVVTSVAISADGQTLVSGSEDGTVRLWDHEGNPIGEPIRGHTDAVTSVAMSADGQTLVSGSWDGTILWWDRGGNPIGRSLRGHTEGVTAVALSVDGQTMISGGWNGTVRLWDRQGNLMGKPLQGHTGTVTSVAISADGQTMISSSEDETLRLWNHQGNPIGEPLENMFGFESVAMSANGQTLVSGSWNGIVQLWNRQGNPLVKPLQGHTASVASVAISADGQTLISSSWDRTVRLWDRQGNSIGEPFLGHTDAVYSVAVSADGQTLISGSRDGTVRLWDRQGNPIGEPFQGHTNGVNSVAISVDGQTIASGSSDETLRLWDRQGNPIGKPFQGHTDLVFSVAMSADGQTLVSGSWDGTVRLWDRQGNPIGRPFQGHTGRVFSVAMSADGQTLVSGSEDGTVRLWDRQGNPIGKPFQGHVAEVHSVAISTDGQTLVSGSRDGTVRLWDRQGNPIGEPFQGHRFFNTIYSVAISSDGQTLVSGSSDKTVRIWPTSLSNGWIAYTCNRLRGYLLVVGQTDDTTRQAHRTCEHHAWK